MLVVLIARLHIDFVSSITSLYDLQMLWIEKGYVKNVYSILGMRLY